LVREAKAKARDKLDKHAAANPPLVAASELTPSVVEPPSLAATRRAILKARPDNQGWAAARSKGVVPLKIALASIERGIRVLSQLFALAETQGHLPKATEDGLGLIVENESIAFGLEERPEKTLHQPTPAHLKRRDERMRWATPPTRGPNTTRFHPDGSPSLFAPTHIQVFAALTQTERRKPWNACCRTHWQVSSGTPRTLASAEENPTSGTAPSRGRSATQREEAFNSREKRRVEFVDAVHEQLTQRDKLTAVLSHLENATSEDAARVSKMATWVRQRLKQIDALISPHFLDISARSSKVDFAEPDLEEEAERGSFYYSPPIALQLWSIDDAKGLATSCSPLEWTDALALPIEGAETG
jgi:hypothetical protein